MSIYEVVGGRYNANDIYVGVANFQKNSDKL